MDVALQLAAHDSTAGHLHSGGKPPGLLQTLQKEPIPGGRVNTGLYRRCDGVFHGVRSQRSRNHSGYECCRAHGFDDRSGNGGGLGSTPKGHTLRVHRKAPFSAKVTNDIIALWEDILKYGTVVREGDHLHVQFNP